MCGLFCASTLFFTSFTIEIYVLDKILYDTSYTVSIFLKIYTILCSLGKKLEGKHIIFNRMLLLCVEWWPLPEIYSHTNPWNLWVPPYLGKGIEDRQKRRKHSDTEEKPMWRWRQRMEWCICKLRNAKNCHQLQQLGDTCGTDSPPEPMEETRPYQHLEFVSQNNEKTNFSCYKPPSLWWLVTAAAGHRYGYDFQLIFNPYYHSVFQISLLKKI